jgi:hypothetical protein
LFEKTEIKWTEWDSGQHSSILGSREQQHHVENHLQGASNEWFGYCPIFSSVPFCIANYVQLPN